MGAFYQKSAVCSMGDNSSGKVWRVCSMDCWNWIGGQDCSLKGREGMRDQLWATKTRNANFRLSVMD